MIPALDTERLTLRGPRREDLADSLAMWSDPDVVRTIPAQPFSEEDVWTRLLRYVGHWQLMGFGYWMVREKASGRYVGEVGFADYKRALDPPFGGAPEIGWVLAAWSHGRGFATEAGRAAIEWGEQHFGRVRTVCLIHPENPRSLRVAEKLGYREYARGSYKGHTAVMLERLSG